MAKKKRRRRKGKGLLLFFLLIIVCAGALVFVVNKLYPQEYRTLVEKKAKEYGLDANLVYAVIRTESKFNPLAKSSRGAKGLMQIMDATGEWGFQELPVLQEKTEFSPELLYSPGVNVEIGCWYLSKLVEQYKNVDTALAAYNAGSGNVAKWVANPEYFNGKELYNIPFKETRDYIQRVNANWQLYEHLRRLVD